MSAYTVGSLFAGGGGIDLGFEWAGFRTAWQVELNEYCRKVLEKRFPHAERFEDVRTVGLHNLSAVDVIVGGFPCQDISNAGQRAGITGERSGLWTEYARIIGELRPRFVFVENVAALLGRGMGVVLGDLASLGYDAEWRIVSAADVGAPHLRERVWIVAYANGEQYEGGSPEEWRSAFAELLADTTSERCGEVGELRPNEPAQWYAGSGEGIDEVSDSSSLGCARSWKSLVRSGTEADGEGQTDYVESVCIGDIWSTEPAVGRVASRIPARVERLRLLGNAVVPQIPMLFARRIYAALENSGAPRP